MTIFILYRAHGFSHAIVRHLCMTLSSLPCNLFFWLLSSPTNFVSTSFANVNNSFAKTFNLKPLLPLVDSLPNQLKEINWIESPYSFIHLFTLWNFWMLGVRDCSKSLCKRWEQFLWNFHLLVITREHQDVREHTNNMMLEKWYLEVVRSSNGPTLWYIL